MPDVIACPNPTCQAPACILDRWTWGSRHGPVEHVKTGRERGQYQAAPATANDPYRRSRFMSVGSAGPILSINLFPEPSLERRYLWAGAE